ncbi:hypothetical protein HYH03_003318 [Edaphochlamys debaryana]|uniref:assimilatory sulfite reductase (ferredoxin) n=1 Tax=Edaphochlamys debaryana TaxID=47281 RepID=A0A836C4A0_9CHLO|nr:hypothetical protein HYH03_003318 [Edaphochlamys debaryana]|eukprot:KAG2498567.1 hypothetical protein HYH03_003318 [Edaphochlamys debaryana]
MQALVGTMSMPAQGLVRPGRGKLVITSVATPTKNPAARLAKRSKVELIKEKSDYLRHPLMEELVNENTFISEDSVQLMKFHGSYMQDHREKRAFGAGKAYMFMMRTRQPSGLVDNRLYLVMDDLADQYGNGTLRLTTRQAYQLHGVLKHDLKTVFSSVIKNMGSTLGACGDVNRNVMGPAVPFKNRPDYVAAQKLANDVADLLAPQSGAYYDMWLDGEKFMSVYKEDPKVTADRAFNGFGTNFENSPEPIYGAQFLPRKFKVATTVPGDNSVDLFTQDLGLVVIMDEADPTKVKGYNVVVGGGMGRTHRDEDTYPRLADPLGFVEAEDVFHAVKAVVAVQRDYGRRDNRKQARLKYLIDEWGIDRFRTVFEQYFGKKIQAFKPLPAWEYRDYLGWGEQGDGKLYYGIYVQNGRLKGEVKKALRAVIEKFALPVTLTPHQNIILRDVDPAHKAEIAAMLRAGGVAELVDWDSLDRLSMACPALPLCGLAVTEAERTLPDINQRIRASMTKVGLAADQELIVRMTGCPNGCARPYMAELGFVGDGPNSYQIYLGGNANQTRLAELYADRVKVKDLETFLEPIFAAYKDGRRPKEVFGDWVARVGLPAVKAAAATAAASLPKPAPVPVPAANGNGNGAAAAASGKQLATK